ncbi:hypothetical protein GOBAR_AA02924 [Gossypium barbadense]|uniref:Uncharacterized protein n=1 Tax=Gossypium barbadense TaxID=3634 RepID=A0A2P5YPX6_GOSBA|nr:hypothetical protein GOBAR_AA02924 [Gossypium barbadense]
MYQSFNQFSMAGDELNRALLVTIYHMLYLITIEVLHQVFSPHGFVQKIVTFQKSAEFYGACAAIQGLCAGENVIGTSLAVPQTSVFKYENSDGDGGVVEALMVLIDTNEYPAILKNKLHQACAAIAFFRALTVKVKGSFLQVKNQALQLDLMFKVPLRLNDYVKGSKLRVLWDDSSGTENYKWLGIEFNWHPRILVVARSDVALLLDFKRNKCNVNCLAKIEMLSPYDVVDEDQFLAFSRVGADGLSELRSQFRDDTYQWETESSFCIILGSFWNFLQTLFSRDILKLVCESDEFGGLILIRLMSSGKNEAQRYCASCDLVQNFDIAHKEPLFNFEDSLLYSSCDDEYEFPKRFKYLNLDYFHGCLNDNLAQGLGSEMQKSHKDFHQE